MGVMSMEEGESLGVVWKESEREEGGGREENEKERR